jgi:hypothetical protein
LLIGELATEPERKITRWSDVTKGALWEKDLEADYGKNWCRLLIGKDIYFYIYHDEGNEFELQFGIYGNPAQLSGYKSKNVTYEFTGPEKSPLKVDKNDVSWIYTDAVLSFSCIEGYRELYKTIVKWLNGLKLGKQAINKLKNHLDSELSSE